MLDHYFLVTMRDATRRFSHSIASLQVRRKSLSVRLSHSRLHLGRCGNHQGVYRRMQGHD